MINRANVREQLCVEVAELEGAIKALAEGLGNLSPTAETAARRQLRVLESELAETIAWLAAAGEMTVTSGV